MVSLFSTCTQRSIVVDVDLTLTLLLLLTLVAMVSVVIVSRSDIDRFDIIPPAEVTSSSETQIKCKDVKSFPLISVSLAISQTPVFTARPRIRG